MPGGPRGALAVNDKLVHGCVYAALTILGLVGGLRRGLVLLVLFSHGALIEVLQGLVPDRTADWRDFLANTTGILLALVVMSLVRRSTR